VFDIAERGLFMPVLRLAIVAMLSYAYFAQGQDIGTVKDFLTKGWAKAENGLVISWHFKSEHPTLSQITIYDTRGRQLTHLRLLSIVPEAASAYVYDVSARPAGIIAVAAVYASKADAKKVRPASALLIFDFDGRLLSFFSLAPSRDIERLEVDEESNIWTLTSIADEDTNPANSFMIVEYTANGDVTKQLLSRNLFPLHAESLRGNSQIGFAAIGYDSMGLWFWLPGSTDFVSVPRDGGSPSLMKTGLPEKDSAGPANIVRTKSGELVAQFRGDIERGPHLYYAWSPSTKLWTRFKPGGCDGAWLIGTDENRQVYLKQNATTPTAADICVDGTK
jgi:hypothetical protein